MVGVVLDHSPPYSLGWSVQLLYLTGLPQNSLLLRASVTDGPPCPLAFMSGDPSSGPHICTVNVSFTETPP